MKYYFISYADSDGEGICEIARKNQILSFDDIMEVTKEIERETGLSEVIINNFIELKKPSKK